MYEHNALGYLSGLALCLTKVRSSRARCPATALIFLIQFNVPFKIISARMRWTNQWVGRKHESPEKNHRAHPQTELGLSYMCLVSV